MLKSLLSDLFSLRLLEENLNFKFRVVIWNIFFWRFGAFSEKDTFTFNAVVVVTSTQIFYGHTACDMYYHKTRLSI